MANGTAGKNGNIGGATTNIDQDDTQIFFIRCQYRQTRCQRLQHQVLNFQTTTTHTLDNVLSRADGSGHNMNPYFKPYATHAQRFAHIFLTIYNEFLRQHMQYLLVGGNIDCLGGLHDSSHIRP